VELDEKLEYAILEMIVGDGITNTREVIDRLVAEGWELKKVLDHLVEMYKRKLFDLKPDPGIFTN